MTEKGEPISSSLNQRTVALLGVRCVELLMIAVPVSVAEGRFWVRPMIQVTAEVAPPRAQQAAISRKEGRAAARPQPRSPGQPKRSEPSHAADPTKVDASPEKMRTPRSEYAHTTRGPEAGARLLRAGCWLHPGLQTRPHLPSPPSASPAAGAAPFTSAATSASLSALAGRARGRTGSGS